MTEQLEKQLADNQWLGGQQPAASDREAFEGLAGAVPDVEKFPHTFAWFSLTSKFTPAVRASWTGAAGAAPKKADAAAGHDAPKAKDDGHGGGGAPAKKETPEEIAKAAQIKAGLFPLGTDPIVANPSGDTRFVVVKVTLLSVGQADISGPVEANVDRLRDAVSAFLADQRIDDMQKRGFRSQMAAQLALAFNRILGPGTVKEIIFPQFVIQ
jgi:flagellar basal body-associated protein FliL